MTTTTTQTVGIAPTDENEIVIKVRRGGPDDNGNWYFCAHWLNDNAVGPTCAAHGVRGSHFIGDLRKFVTQNESVGIRIRYI